MRLSLYKELPTRVPETRIRRLFELVSRSEGRPSRAGTVNLVFTGDARLRKLNARFRGLAKATDVLSFNIDDPADEDGVFGEVYISVQTATRQARQRGSTLAQEYLRLSCHGFLHLFGHDHRVYEGSAMERREDHFLRLLKETAS